MRRVSFARLWHLRKSSVNSDVIWCCFVCRHSSIIPYGVKCIALQLCVNIDVNYTYRMKSLFKCPSNVMLIMVFTWPGLPGLYIPGLIKLCTAYTLRYWSSVLFDWTCQWSHLCRTSTSRRLLETHLFRKYFPDYMLDINWLSRVDLAVVPLLKPPKNLLIDWFWFDGPDGYGVKLLRSTASTSQRPPSHLSVRLPVACRCCGFLSTRLR